MCAGWRHAAALRRGQGSRGVRCAAGGARRQQGGNGLRALRCALSRRRRRCVGAAAPAPCCALHKRGASARERGWRNCAAPSVYLHRSAACLSRVAATRAAAHMRAAACRHGCGTAAERGRGGVRAGALVHHLRAAATATAALSCLAAAARRRAAPRLCLRAPPAWARARYSPPTPSLTPLTSELITLPPLHMPLGCGLSLSPARYCCLRCARGAVLR
jgi:hypothetical protein